MIKTSEEGSEMYLNILKKDLKRKKTMNIIVLLFIILSAMFAASSVNNIIAVMTGLDSYFDKAGMTDYFIIALDNQSGDMEQNIRNEKSVTEIRKEPGIFVDGSNLTRGGEKLADIAMNAVILMPADEAKLNYYNTDNEKITEVESGKAYITGNIPNAAKLVAGDKFMVEIGDTKHELEYAGFAKDAFLGSPFLGNSRIIMNRTDYDIIGADERAKTAAGGIYYINTDDIPALEKAFAGMTGIMFDGSRDQMKTSYIMSVLVAALLMIVSICLILVAFVVLRFTIHFTLEEEFREIGVMKAIGINNGTIRGLYLVKYFVIAVIGALIGFICSIPFGNMMLDSVSETMVLGTDNSVLTALLCSIAVVGIIMLFCWSSTRRIKKLSPIDAVRSGQTGERFRKKSIMHLGKSRLGTTGFLAVNDVISSRKQYGIITLVFTILILLVMILANTANTLGGEKLLFLFGTTRSDVYIKLENEIMDAVGIPEKSDDLIKGAIDRIEKALADNGMPGEVHMERMYQIPMSYGNEKLNVMFQYCPQTNASDYVYSEGTAPVYDNEIAVTTQIAERFGAKIGDTVTLTVNGEERECIITALFQSFNQLGKIGRLHESFDVKGLALASSHAFQIDFDDHPDDAVILQRIQKRKDIYNTDYVFNAAGHVKDCTGAADIISAVKNMILIITLVIVIMIAVLMERSFISREKPEIALMKAVGFNNGSVIAHHAVRFAIVALLSSVLAAVLCMPLTKLTIDPIMGIMGAVNGVGYDIKPAEIFGLYPLIIIAVTILASALTALYTKTIKASDTADIE